MNEQYEGIEIGEEVAVGGDPGWWRKALLTLTAGILVGVVVLGVLVVRHDGLMSEAANRSLTVTTSRLEAVEVQGKVVASEVDSLRDEMVLDMQSLLADGDRFVVWLTRLESLVAQLGREVDGWDEVLAELEELKAMVAALDGVADDEA